MKNLLFSLFAIGVAAVAAMTATTAMLNAPHRTVAPAIISASSEQSPPSALADTKPAAAQGAPPAAPANSAGAKPASGTAAATAVKRATANVRYFITPHYMRQSERAQRVSLANDARCEVGARESEQGSPRSEAPHSFLRANERSE